MCKDQKENLQIIHKYYYEAIKEGNNQSDHQSLLSIII